MLKSVKRSYNLHGFDEDGENQLWETGLNIYIFIAGLDSSLQLVALFYSALMRF